MKQGTSPVPELSQSQPLQLRREVHRLERLVIPAGRSQRSGFAPLHLNHPFGQVSPSSPLFPRLDTSTRDEIQHCQYRGRSRSKPDEFDKQEDGQENFDLHIETSHFRRNIGPTTSASLPPSLHLNLRRDPLDIEVGSLSPGRI
jgi:hypothetical protein